MTRSFSFGPTFVTPMGARLNPHQFTRVELLHTFTTRTKGTATGIGDITIRLKGNVMQREAVRVALGLDIRIPTGNARQLLGSGSTGIRPFIAISTGKRVSPHANIGYQYNGSSILAGNLTGTTFSEDCLRSQDPTTDSRRTLDQRACSGKLFLFPGADIGLTNRVTLAFDYLGQTVFNAPRVFRSSLITANIPGGTGAITLPDIEGRKETMTLNSGAAGVKVNLFGGLLLTADILFRLDNNGLRQNVTPLIGLSRTFGK